MEDVQLAQEEGHQAAFSLPTKTVTPSGLESTILGRNLYLRIFYTFKFINYANWSTNLISFFRWCLPYYSNTVHITRGDITPEVRSSVGRVGLFLWEEKLVLSEMQQSQNLHLRKPSIHSFLHPSIISWTPQSLNSYHTPDTTLGFGIYPWAKTLKIKGILFMLSSVLEEIA